MLVDFSENAAGAARDQIFAEGNAELVSLLRFAGYFCLDDGCTLQICNKTSQSDSSTFHYGVTGNGNLAAPLESGEQSPFRRDGHACGHVIEHT